MSKHVHQEYDTIHFGDPVVLLFHTLFVFASTVLIWDAVGVVPKLLIPHAGPTGDAMTSSADGLGLFIAGWVVVTALTIAVTRRRRRGVRA